MDILLTGGSGQVGIELRGLDWPDGIRLHAPDRGEFDLADAHSISRLLDARRWAAILSCGAYTAVDRAEQEVGAAWRVNALAPALLAVQSREAGIPIVHVSTDYVFGGDKDAPYVETDPVAPLNVYGASKEGGEQAVRTANPRHAIVRTSWVVSPHRTNFVRTMLRLAAERDRLSIVSDQVGCPTAAGDLARALQAITLEHLRSADAPAGTFHFAGAGETSWSGFASAIFARSAQNGGPRAVVQPIVTADYPTPAKRPKNSRLSTAKIEAAFGIRPRRWQEAVGEIVDALVGDGVPR